MAGPGAPHRVFASPGGCVRVRFGHIWVDALRFDAALDRIELLVRAGRGGSVFTPNVDHVVTAEDDPLFRAAYAEVDLSLADGQPLVWTSRLLGARLPEKISGSDLVWPLLLRAARLGWRVYLLGGAPGVGQAVADRLERELGLRMVGVDAAAIVLDEAAGTPDLALERVRAARPDLLLVALGSPKQERWIHRALPRLRPAVAVGVGASFDFLAGRVRRAPRWMSRAGLEWLYRLWQEPRRLAVRYLSKDPRFLLVLLRSALRPRAQRVRDC
ncbi:MAG: WecB/TagA/CpsF family glycosyltransferase [Deltaproteobacteria bacterium]|nr:WecB/TagA/CpsF family glycosyltransferase [Deltaproteobacteria bacterium]